MRTVGIIGGLGPSTTAEFYLQLILTVQEKESSARPPILIWSVPLPYEIEKDSILNATGEERNIPYLVEAARTLEKGGANFVVMPCNTLHAFIKEIRSSVKIPVLSIVEETISFLKERDISRVGLISTASIRKNKLYEKALASAGITYEIPTEPQQEHISKIIHGLVTGRPADDNKNILENIINSLAERGIEHVILACTDLQLLKPKHETIKIYDTMTILKDSTINQMLGNF